MFHRRHGSGRVVSEGEEEGREEDGWARKEERIEKEERGKASEARKKTEDQIKDQIEKDKRREGKKRKTRIN